MKSNVTTGSGPVEPRTAVSIAAVTHGSGAQA